MNLACQPPTVVGLIADLQDRGLPYPQALIEAWKEHLSVRAAHYDDLAHDPQQQARFVLGTQCSNLAEPIEDLHTVARLLGADVHDELDRFRVLGVIAEAFLVWHAA